MGEERVLRRMKRQHGLTTRAQALADGMTRGQLERRLRTGRWVRAARGVYRHSAVSPTPLSRLLSVCLAHDAVASHRSAAALHRIDGFRLNRIEVLVPSGRSLAIEGVTVYESTQLDRARPVRRQGVPCTGLERTVLDLASVLDRQRLDRTIDAVLRDGQLQLSDLCSVLVAHACRGRPGCAALRAALDARLGDDPVPLSGWSRMVEDLLIDSRLDRPRLEYRICGGDGALIAQVDLHTRIAASPSSWTASAGTTTARPSWRTVAAGTGSCSRVGMSSRSLGMTTSTVPTGCVLRSPPRAAMPDRTSGRCARI